MEDSRIQALVRAANQMKDGNFQAEIPAETGDGGIAALGRALQELGATLEARSREADELATIAEKVSAGLTLDEVCDHVYDSFQELIPYERIGVSLLEDNAVRARWARSAAPEIKLGEGYAARLEGSSLQGIIDTGQPRILNDLEAYLSEHPSSDSTRLIVEEGLRSSLTCPLIAQAKPVGFMFFSSTRKDAYRSVHVETFRQIAGQLSTTLEKGRLYQRLVELNELKNKFLGSAAHDLRSPLNIIFGYLRLMLRPKNTNFTDSQHKMLVSMGTSCENMLGLINDLLDISAIESGRLDLSLDDVDPVEFLTTWHESGQLLAQEKSIDLLLELPPELPPVWIDRRRISQVIDNLVTNAVKFSHSGTTVTISAKLAREAVTVSVTDQGQGIPEEEVPKLFGDFSKTSVRPTAGEKSTGLGLAIVKRIVEAHQGRIWVKTETGKGSTFSFTVPTVPREE